MKCQFCGNIISDESVFCPVCGKKQEKLEETVNIEVTAEKVENKCIECGSAIPEESLFCPTCGAKQEKVEKKSESHREEDTSNDSFKSFYENKQNEKSSKESNSKNKNSTAIFGIVIIAIMAACVAYVVLSFIVKPSVNLNKYMTVYAEGYDTVGKAVVEFDTEKFEEDYRKKLEGNAGKFINDVVSGKIDKESGLSNGDIIVYSWNCNDNKATDKYGIKLKYKDIEYKVKGLNEVETFDAFDGIEVTFSGVAPAGRAELTGTPNDAAGKDLSYTLDKSDGLNVGDKVTVTAKIYHEDDVYKYCAEKYGKVPTTLEKEYTVEGLDRYINSLSELSDDGLKTMQNQAEDVYKAKEVSKYVEGESLKGFDYIGNYLLTSKNSDRYGANNIAILVYKVTVNNAYSNGSSSYNKNNSYYWFIAYKNVLVNDQGQISLDVTDYSTPQERFKVDSGVSSGWWSTKAWSYYGYENITDLYNDTVTCNMDFYNHEDNVDESVVATVASVQEEEPSLEKKTEGLKKINIDSISTSSTLNTKSKDHSTYVAQNMIDNDLTTAWLDGVNGIGIGETVNIEFNENKKISEIDIYPGYQKNKYRYSINGQPTKLLIEWNGGEREMDLKRIETSSDEVPFGTDESPVEKLIFDSEIETNSIKMTILDAVTGSKYMDTAISEVIVYSAE